MEHRVAADELRDGEMREVRAGKRRLLLVRAGNTYRAFGGTCPHYGAPLAEGLLHDGRVLCPWHQSVYDALRGDLLEPPSLAALPGFAVRVDGDSVLVDVPDDAGRQRPMPMAEPDPDADGRLFAVIGGGAVAGAAAGALREAGFRGRILIVSAEDRWPYDRPNLTKDYLAGDAGADWLPLRPDGFYERHGVERLHDTVVGLDVQRRVLRLLSGAELAPDAVLVASGAEPRRLDVPGHDLPGVLTLRSWDDCERLKEQVQHARQVVVVGASFIGMEVAASLAQLGRRITVVAPDEVPFARVLGATVGGVLLGAHRTRGTEFRLGRRPVALHGYGGVTTVELDDGEMLAADLVVLGVGVTPRTAFIEGVTRCDDGGLRVDEELRVAPGVWAGGDAARYPEPHVGEPVRIEHWRLAEQHGRAAAFSMAGQGRPFDGVPFFWTQQAGLTLGFAGVAGRWSDEIVTGDPEEGDFTVFYAAGDRLRAACGTRDKELDVFAELMRQGRLPAAAALRSARGGLESFL
jgi:apoptosis-inducing factor 3